MKEKVIVGLDIGTTKICCIVAKKCDGKKIEILGSGVVQSRGVKDGVVLNIQDTADDIIAACNKAREKTGVEIKRVFVGIAGAHVRSNVHKMGFQRQDIEKLIDEEDIRMLEEQVKLLNNAPGDKIISYQSQEFFVDNQVPISNNPKGMIGSRLEASWHVITGNELSTKSIERCVKLAGLEMIDFDLEPIASAASVLTQDQLENGVCLIDIGGGTTDMAIFTKGIIRHTAIFPYAGEYITSIVQDKLKLSYAAANKLKETSSFTSAMYKHIQDNKSVVINNIPGLPPISINQKYYCHIVNACLEQLFGLVRNELSTSYYKDHLNAGIVITGGGAMIPDIKNFVEQCLGMHTSIGLPTSRLTNLQDKSYAQPRFSTGIGLALLASEFDNENIIEPEVEREVVETVKEEPRNIGKDNKSWLDRAKESVTKALFVDSEMMKDFVDSNNNSINKNI